MLTLITAAMLAACAILEIRAADYLMATLTGTASLVSLAAGVIALVA